MKKISYWFSIAFGVVLGLLASSVTELFNTPNRAISYKEQQYKDTLFSDADGLTHKAVVLNGAIWNSGQTTIDTSEVREPLKITLDQAKQILGFNIIWQTHPITSRFRLSQMDSSTLGINWQHFDPNNGFSFQIIYAGSERVKLKPRGRILYLTNYTRVNPLLGLTLGLDILCIVGGFSMFVFFTKRYFTKNYYGVWEIIGLLLGASFFLALAILYIPILIEVLRYPSFESIVSSPNFLPIEY